jgi:hypothetical protein
LNLNLGQTAAFAVRALSGIARGETDGRSRPVTGTGTDTGTGKTYPKVLEKYHSPGKVIGALVGMLREITQPENGTTVSSSAAASKNAQAETHTHDPGLNAHVLSEAVVCVATLAQSKVWRWRMLDVRTTALVPVQGPPCVKSIREESVGAPGKTDTKASSPSTAAKTVRENKAHTTPSDLVGALARLLGDNHPPEIVFNVLYCVNCLIGEPPQSWGRGRDVTREEVRAARFPNAAVHVSSPSLTSTRH